jgi:hypothetical protein
MRVTTRSGNSHANPAVNPGQLPREAGSRTNRTRRARFDAFIRRLCEEGTAERRSLSPIADLGAFRLGRLRTWAPPDLGAFGLGRLYCVRRAVATVCRNRACMAAEISWSVLTWKNSPGEAQLCMLPAICGWNGAI